MISSEVTAELAFNQDLRGGSGPAGPTITMNVTSEGFFTLEASAVRDSRWSR